MRKIKIFFRTGFLFFCVGCLFTSTQKANGKPLIQKQDEISFHNEKVELVINKSPWHLKMISEYGQIQYEEAQAPSFQINDQWVTVDQVKNTEKLSDRKYRLNVGLDNGKDATVLIEYVETNGFHISITGQGATAIKGSTRLKMVEEVYGFGEMWNGHVAQRGQLIELWDKAGTPDECAYMPYYVTTDNYAFFLDYGGKVVFDVGQRKADELVYSAETDRFDLYLFSGTSIPDAVSHFLDHTGKPPVPPRWSFKPWFWLMSDPDQPEASIETLKGHHLPEMVQRLKAMDIPVGATWFEPPWQTARTSSIPNPEFDKDLKGLIRKLSDMGVNTLAWTVPYTAPTSPNWQEAVDKGYLAIKQGSKADYSDVKISKSGEAEGTYYNYIDFFNPEARDWWKREISKALDLGFKGFKPDAGQTLQKDAVLYEGRLGKDVHNSYAREYNSVFYEALSEKCGNDFLMVPRAAWVGSSALTNFKWPGDLSGSFANNGLPSTVYSSLSLALCGIPFVSTDIGGFQDRPSPENVWVRWAQFGAMLPGMQTLHMPWWYSDKAASHFRFLSWLHTELTPLWMTLANEAHETGAPVCRPLVWNYQDDVDCWRVDDEFMVGNQLLVAPILNPEKDRKVYLPEGRWIDFWNNKKVYAGKQTIRWSAKDSYSFPLFIKEGAIIPLEVENDVTGFGWEESKGYTTLAIWPGTNMQSSLKLKDKDSDLLIKCEGNTEGIKISWDQGNTDFIFRIQIDKDLAPQSIVSKGKTLRQTKSIEEFETGKSAGWYFDPASLILWIKQVKKEGMGSLQINMK